jgi:hypothetical protein
VSATWIAAEVKAGRLRWVIGDATGSPPLPGDTRSGSQAAITVVQRACRAVSLPSSTMYDCRGKAAAILAIAQKTNA